jgi:hypothetical protein
MIYRSFNASAFANVSYNSNAEVSWGTLQGIIEAFPNYIPKKRGTFVKYHEQEL